MVNWHEYSINKHLNWEEQQDRRIEDEFNSLDLECSECGHVFSETDDFSYDGSDHYAYCPECEMSTRVV